MAKKDGALTQEWTCVAKVETRLNQTTELLRLANEKVKVIKGETTSIIVWAMVEYKVSDDFINDIDKAEMACWL